MKHPFKPSKSNIIYAGIVAIIIILLNIRLYGFDAYGFGMSLGSIIGIVFISTVIASLFWLILGRKEKGGTTTFNIVLTLMLLGSMSEFGRIAQDRQKPIDNLKSAISDYKESAFAHPDSIDSHYFKLSDNVKKSLEDLIKTSQGEERKLYLALQEFFNKSDSVNVEWTRAFSVLSEPRILDFAILNNKTEYEYQKKAIQEYIDQSINYKLFVQNRMDYLLDLTKHIDKNTKAYKGFIRGMTKKDSLHRPIFMPYIQAHIEYGEGIKKIIELLEKEDGKWTYEYELPLFENSASQDTFEMLLDNAIDNEYIINELFDELIEVM